MYFEMSWRQNGDLELVNGDKNTYKKRDIVLFIYSQFLLQFK